jgi:hypothetical protein
VTESGSAAAGSPTGPGRAIRARWTALLPTVAIAAAFVHALSAGWRRWGDLIVDTGRELDLPRRLAEGQLLYRDARYYYGPLAPYVNAALYRVFGVHLDVLVWAGIASAALLCAALYRIGRHFLGRVGSTAVVVTFIYLCAFAHLYVGAIFNFVLPYTFAATYGACAAAWTLALLLDHVRSGGAGAFYLSTGCLALAALTKLEAFIPAVAAHAVFAAAGGPRRSGSRRLFGAGYAGAAGAVLGVYGFFALRVGPSLWDDNLAGVVNAGSDRFVRTVMGLSHLGASLLAIVASVALLAAMLAVAYGASRLMASGVTLRLTTRRSGVAGWSLAAAAAISTFLLYRAFELHVHFRALPALMAAVIAYLAMLSIRRRENRAEWLPHLLLWVFGLACLWRIPLNSRPHHYGFYLLPVGLVCFAVLCFDYGPRLAGGGEWASRLFSAAGLGMLAAGCTIAFSDSRQFDALHRSTLSTPRGELRIFDRWRFERSAVAALQRLPGNTRLLVLPQGSGLLFFSGLREADTMFSYLPMEVADLTADQNLLARWKDRPPDVIAFVGVPLTEFGSAGFGKDYARLSMEWILETYAPVSDLNAPIVFLRRRGEPRPTELRLEADEDPGPQGRVLEGTVVEALEFEGHTLLSLRTQDSTLWVAVPETSVAPDTRVRVVGARPGAMEERGIRRRFDRLLVGELAPVESVRVESGRASR